MRQDRDTSSRPQRTGQTSPSASRSRGGGWCGRLPSTAGPRGSRKGQVWMRLPQDPQSVFRAI